MPLDVRQTMWESACIISDHVRNTRRLSGQAPNALHFQFNGGVAPEVADHYARILMSGGLPDTANILDLGCGFGRIAMALAPLLGPGHRYFGLDPNVEGLAWAKANIGAHHKNFFFDRIDVQSGPYNPAGTQRGDQFRFPFDDESLDLVFMISVLTHVDLPTVRTYLLESARTLKPTGRLIATIFLLDDEVERLIAEGRSRFRLPAAHGPSRIEDPRRPELVIAHPRDAVQNLLKDAGFAQSRIVEGHWSGRQSAPMDFQDLLMASRDPDAILDPATRYPAEVGDAILLPADMADRLADFGDRNSLLDFIVWSVALSVNLLWWGERELTLAMANADGTVTPLSYDLSALLRTGIQFHHPSGTPDDSFHAIDEPGIVALLIKANGAAGKEDILSCMFEAARNGLVLRDRMQAGERFVLASSPRSVTIPDCPARKPLG